MGVIIPGATTNENLPGNAKTNAAAKLTTPPDQAQHTFNVQNAPTGTTGLTVAQSKRQMLIHAGYDVAPTGGDTPRLDKAYAHFSATRGTGAKVWNAHNTKVVTPAPGGRAPAPVGPAVPPIGSGNPTTGVPTGAVPGTLAFSKQLLAQLAAEFKPYSGATGQAPVINANQVGAAQANEQFGGAINQQKTDINSMLGAEPGAQQNIANYFAKPEANAAAAIGSDDAASAANVASQAKLSPDLAAALGLTGANAGSIGAAGQNATDFAGNIGQIQHADDVAAQASASDAEKDAHQTEDANNTIALSGARTNLINQIANKGNAQVADTAAAKQQNFANQGQAITNAGAISNINATNAMAASTVEGADLDNQTKQQALSTNQQANSRANITLTDNLKNSALTRGIQKATAKLNLDSQVVNIKKTIMTPIPDKPGSFHQTPFYAIPVGTRQDMADKMFSTVTNLGPAKAAQALNQYMTGTWGYTSTPTTRAFVQSILADHHWDPTKNRWTK